MSQTAKFLRSDGVEMITEVGSPSFEMMARDGSFQRVYTEADSLAQLEPAADAVAKTVSLDEMTKAGLMGFAAERGIEVNPKLTKNDMAAAIKAALEAEEAEEVEEAEDTDGDDEQ